MSPLKRKLYFKNLHNLSLLSVVILSACSYLIADMVKQEVATNSTTSHVGLYIILQYSFIAIFMLLAWYSSPKSNKLTSFKALFITAIIARLLLVGADLYTSNDVDRYLFDGRITYEGYDPYSISHDHPALAQLKEQWQPPEEHAAYVTIYPPLALGLFTLAAATGVENAQLTWEIMLLIASIAIVFLSALLLKKLNKLKHIALIALSPILILEAGIGLHIDTFLTLTIVAAIYAWQQHKTALCGVLIALGVLLKILPVMLLLPLFFLQKSIKSAFLLVLTCFTTIIISYAITLALGLYPVGSIGVFFEKWRFASPLFSLLDSLFSVQTTIAILALFASILACGIAYFCLSHRYKNANQQTSIFIAIQLALAIPLLISPVVFPWYLMALVPLLALSPNIYLMAWLLIMPITYEVVSGYVCCNTWVPALWPVYILGVLYSVSLIKIFRSFIQQWPLLTPYLALKS